VGVRALKTPRIEADVGFSASLGSHSSDIAARRGMANLGTMIEFGPRLKANLGDVTSDRSESRLQFPLREVIDVSHGFRSLGVAFEPQWVTDTRLANRWFISTNLGAMFGDSNLANTFYGVAPNEATPTRVSYTARDGLIALRAGLLAAHALTPDVRMFYIIRFDSLAGAANHDSPLVRRNVGWSAGIGLAWTLARSEHSAND
jgi:outer membrane protein